MSASQLWTFWMINCTSQELGLPDQKVEIVDEHGQDLPYVSEATASPQMSQQANEVLRREHRQQL